MPFVSDKQRRFLYSQKPEVAEKFARHSGKPKKHGKKSHKGALKRVHQ